MKKKKVIPSYWTNLLRTVRKEWAMKNPERKDTYKKASVKIDELKRWVCATCKNAFAYSDTECDHVVPVQNTVPQDKVEFLESFLRLHSADLQILCKPCHKIKTKLQLREKAFELNSERISKFLEVEKKFIMDHLDLEKSKEFIRLIDRSEKMVENPKSKERFIKKIRNLSEKYL